MRISDEDLDRYIQSTKENDYMAAGSDSMAIMEDLRDLRAAARAVDKEWILYGSHSWQWRLMGKAMTALRAALTREGREGEG